MTTGQKIVAGFGVTVSLGFMAGTYPWAQTVLTIWFFGLVIWGCAALTFMIRVIPLRERLLRRLIAGNRNPLDCLSGHSLRVQTRAISWALWTAESDDRRRIEGRLMRALQDWMLDSRLDAHGRITFVALALRLGWSKHLDGLLSPSQWRDPELQRAIVKDSRLSIKKRYRLLESLANGIPEARELLEALSENPDAPPKIRSRCQRWLDVRAKARVRVAGAVSVVGSAPDGGGLSEPSQ